MLWLVARRLGSSVLIVFLVTSATFFMIRLAPGDAFTRQTESRQLSQAQRQALRHSIGIDRPWPEQYARYLARAAGGDLGTSIKSGQAVLQTLALPLLRTLGLMSVALLASFALGIVLGVMQGARQHSWADRVSSAGALFFFSVPDFWLALMAVLVFAQWLGWFPTSGIHSPRDYDFTHFERIVDVAWHMVLPVVTLTLLIAAGIMRHQRSAVIDVAHENYVRTARAKGASERRVLFRHVLRNALLPTITLVGLYAPALVGGAFFIEWVFAWPGMGLYATRAITERDYPLVTGAVIITSAMVSIGSMVADVLNAAADPRLRAT